MRSRLIVVAALVAALGALAACSEGEAGGERVDVIESEWVVEPTPNSVEAGDVTFKVDNHGNEEHELVIVKGDDPDALPTVADGSVAEDQLGHEADVGHIEGVQAGATKTATFKLEKGSYILICNLVDEMGDVHYAEGMVSTLTVT